MSLHSRNSTDRHRQFNKCTCRRRTLGRNYDFEIYNNNSAPILISIIDSDRFSVYFKTRMNKLIEARALCSVRKNENIIIENSVWLPIHCEFTIRRNA